MRHVYGSSRATRAPAATAAAIVSVVLLTADAAMQTPPAKPQSGREAAPPYVELDAPPLAGIERRSAAGRRSVGHDPSLVGLSRVAFPHAEEDIRRGPMRCRPPPPAFRLPACRS